MKVETRHEAGYWSVYVNDRRMVDRDSYQVASNVAYALKHGAQGRMESDEVARAILDWMVRA